MTKVDKIIADLDALLDYWVADDGVHDDIFNGVSMLKTLDEARDTLELLKYQEPIPCGEKIKAGDVMLDFYECGYCKNAIRKPWKYCPFCGKAVKWDEKV